MKALLENVQTTAAALTVGLSFLAESTEAQVGLNYHLNAFPGRKLTELAPFCLIHPLSGGIEQAERGRKVCLRYVFYQPDRAQALVELDALVAALYPLSHPGGWTPWVAREFSDSFGDEEGGMQPHPLYCYTIIIDFFASVPVLPSPWR